MKHIHFAAVLASLLTTLAPALAQNLLELPTYQGRLMDNGQPADGTYQVRTYLYDAEIGGSFITGSELLAVEVTDGLFTIPLYPFEFVGDQHPELWLEIGISPTGPASWTKLTPRQLITPAPFALRAKRAFNAETANTANTAQAADFALTSGTGLNDAYLNDPNITSLSGTPVTISGAAFRVSDRINVGLANSSSGSLYLYNDTSNNALVSLQASGSLGGRLSFSPEGGSSSTLYMGQGSYSGGFLIIRNDDVGGTGFQLSGNYQGSGASSFLMYDAAGNEHTRFNASVATGTDSIILKDGAIDAFEILNEPGVAGTRKNAANTALSTSTLPFLSRSITAPASGYFVLNGVAEVLVNHTTGTDSTVTIGFGVDSNLFLQGIELSHRIPAAMPSAQYEIAIPAHDLYQVSGPNTREIRLLLLVAGGTASIVDSAMSAVYVPTAYGSTISSVMHNPNTKDGMTPTRMLTGEEIQAERKAEGAWTQDQIVQRMLRMEAKIEAQAAELRKFRTNAP